MGVSERQALMLEEMGIRVWTQPMPSAAPVDAPVVTHAAPRADAPVDRREAPLHVEAPRVAAPRAPAQAPAQAPAIVRAPSAGASVIATMDWPALRDAVAECTACKLCEDRTQTVFGVGNEQAHWMIVGEAPGEQEESEGEPFVGKSGQLLDNMLRAVGLARTPGTPDKQVYITNTVKCRPPFNRNPEPAELSQCEPYLVRQIALVKPRVIVAMGRFAVQSLLRSQEPIGRLRGRVHTYEGVPLIVTYHPAYLLRNPEDKGRAWDDLCLAREVLSAAA